MLRVLGGEAHAGAGAGTIEGDAGGANAVDAAVVLGQVARVGVLSVTNK